MPDNAPDLKTLVVDDDELALRFIETSLRRLGVSDIQTTPSAAEALDLMVNAETPFEMILFDLHMPGRDGIELIGDLSAAGFDGCVGIISGAKTYLLDSAESLGRHLGLRVVGSLMKPVTPEKLQPLFEKARTAGEAP